jgi:hypothetical protein
MANQPDPKEVRAENARVSRAGGNPVPPASPWNYDIDEEVERRKAMDRANDKVPNDPSRPIL